MRPLEIHCIVKETDKELGHLKQCDKCYNRCSTQIVHRYTEEELLKEYGRISIDYSKYGTDMVCWCFRKCSQGECVG